MRKPCKFFIRFCSRGSEEYAKDQREIEIKNSFFKSPMYF